MIHPSIVISVGDLINASINQVIPIIQQQTDKKRSLLTSFFSLTNDFLLQPFDQINHDSSINKDTNITGNDILNSKIDRAQDLTKSLLNEIANRCSDNVLIQAGFSKLSDIRPDIYIFADLTNTESTASLLTLALIIQKIMSIDSHVSSFLILNIATFESNLDLAQRIKAAILDVSEIINQRSTKRKNLYKKIDTSDAIIPDIPIFLLDRVKTDGSYVKDIDEMKINIGNILYSLLQNNFSDALEAKLDVVDKNFSSFGSALLTLDPGILESLCAEKTKREFIVKQLLSQEENTPYRLSYSENIISNIGSLEEIIGSAYEKLPPPIVVASADLSKMEPALKLRDLTPPELDYMNLRSSTWVEYINSYGDRFDKTTLPFLRKNITEHFKVINSDLEKMLFELSNKLVFDSQLYSGGIKNAIFLMENTRYYFNDFYEKTKRYLHRAEEALKTKQSEFQQNIVRVNELIVKAPQPPFFVKWLPKNIAQWFCLFYIPWRYKLKLLDLQNFMQETIRSLESYCLMEITIKVLKSISGIPNGKINIIDNAIQEYENFYKKISSESEIKYPNDKSEEINNPNEIFRYSLARPEWVEWGINNWPVDEEGWLDHLLKEPEFINNWRNLEPKYIQNWVYNKAKEHFHKWYEIDLQKIFYEIINKKGEEQVVKLLEPLIAASSPLLNPSFDAVGTNYSHGFIDFYLLGDSSWPFLRPEGLDLKHFNIYPTNDPFTISFIRCELGIPINALPQFRDISKHSKSEWEKYRMIT